MCFDAFCHKYNSHSLIDIVNQTDRDRIIKGRRGEAALASVQVDITQNQITASLSNIGDTVIIILDGETLSVKQTLLPRVKYRGFNAWSPQSAQEYRTDISKNKPVQCAQITQVEHLNPNDIIIQMTDGMCSEFEFFTMQSHTADDEIWQEYQIDEQ